MEHKMPRTIDVDTGKRHDITVTEGPYSSTRRISFGGSFSIALSYDDVVKLAEILRKAH